MNKLENKEYNKKWESKNKEHRREYKKEYYQKNKEKISEWQIKYFKKYYKKYKEKILANHKKWKENNPEYLKNYRQENKEKTLEYNRIWIKTDKGKIAKQRENIKRRVRGREIINTLTAQEWQDILKQYNHKCAYCGKDLFNLFAKPEKDHVIPISKGGDNIKENVVPACQSCNSKKHNKIIKEVILK